MMPVILFSVIFISLLCDAGNRHTHMNKWPAADAEESIEKRM